MDMYCNLVMLYVLISYDKLGCFLVLLQALHRRFTIGQHSFSRHPAHRHHQGRHPEQKIGCRQKRSQPLTILRRQIDRQQQRSRRYN